MDLVNDPDWKLIPRLPDLVDPNQFYTVVCTRTRYRSTRYNQILHRRESRGIYPLINVTRTLDFVTKLFQLPGHII